MFSPLTVRVAPNLKGSAGTVVDHSTLRGRVSSVFLLWDIQQGGHTRRQALRDTTEIKGQKTDSSSPSPGSFSPVCPGHLALA